MNYPKNFGLIVEPPEPERYQLLGGALNTEVLLEDGDWSSYLPPFEPQASPYFDVAACTIYAFCGAIETLAKKKGYDIGDFSERFLAIVSDNQPPYGNTPGKVAQTAHSIGLIQNSALPWDSSFTSIGQYYSPKPMTPDLIKLANQFLKKWKIGYGDVGSDKASIQEALRHSPLTAGVCAWYPDGQGNFRFPDGAPYNHDVLLYKMDDFYRIFDSYEQDHKAIVPEAKLGFVMGYTLEPNTEIELTLIQKIINFCRQIIGLQTILVERKLEQLPTAPKEVVTHVSLIKPWALAIQKEEGGHATDINMRLNNPGNLKFTDLTKSLGAEQGWEATDGGYFCKFKTYEQGFNALCSFLEMACRDELKAFHQARTLKLFTEVYAHPPSSHPYAENVAKALNAKVEDNISNFL